MALANSRLSIDSHVSNALKAFTSEGLDAAGKVLLNALGYTSDKTADLGRKPEDFLKTVESYRPDLGPINRDKVRASAWKECAFLFQLTNDEIPFLASQQELLPTGASLNQNQIESFVFIAIRLSGDSWSRTSLADISRELNRRFPMPAILLFHHGDFLSLGVIERRLHKRDTHKDVVERRIIVIKDVRIARPHRAHVAILSSIAIKNLNEKRPPTNFSDLYQAWLAALSIEELNKRFYRDLFLWYIWALKEVDFPEGGGADADKRNSVGLIRLLTRLIFVWFIKESGLVPEDLFDPARLQRILKKVPGNHPDETNYYLGILQNLFFATLNVEMGAERKWAADGSGMKSDRLIHSLYRHKKLFENPDEALALFASIPFLNGGLFECLDRDLSDRDLERNPELKALASSEGTGMVLRVDGFSRRAEAQPKIPNKIFFGGAKEVDLNEEMNTKGKRQNVDGLIDILQSYKFTVDENTPLEEEVALDPELLGKVFENLLASYNEDTQSTARKKSGSFYTPRVVVDYMVEQSLIAYLLQQAPDIPDAADRFQALVSATEQSPLFSPDETTKLIAAIERLRVLDPACGSGAYPMGMLTKLVQVLKRLDPDNTHWREQNRKPLERQLKEAEKISDPALREEQVESIQRDIDTFDKNFADTKHADYSRKLYLIEKCIHGVDLQPIAVQIAKLRFFISLVVSQQPDSAKPNGGITALPNLETKIVAANTLLSILGEQTELRSEEVSDKEKELNGASKHYFAARTNKTKRKWRDKIISLRDDLAQLFEDGHSMSGDAARKLVQWNPFDQNASAPYFEPEWMFQLAEGFDICIGNPPYVRQEAIKDQKEALKHYECASGTADLYVYFYERSIKLLKPGGAFTFITSNKWFRAKYGEKLRGWMVRNTRIHSIIDFGDAEVFDAIAYPTIIVASRRSGETSQAPRGEALLAFNWTDPDREAVKHFPEVFDREAFEVPTAELRPDGWQLEPPTKRILLERIRKAGKPLGEYVGGRFYRGILTGLNEAFVIDTATRDRLIAEDPKSADIIKPFLRGRDVKRWAVEFDGQYLIRIESSENKTHPWSGKPEAAAEKVFAKCYPAIYKWFKQHKEAMISRYDQGQYYWELRSCAYWNEFEQAKIFVPAIEDGVNYAPDVAAFYGNDKTNIIVTDEWKYVLAVLNSSLSWWLTQQVFSGKQGGYYEFKPMYVSQVPIPKVSTTQRTQIETVVDAVIATRDPRFEQLLNGLVFELFFPDDLHQAKIALFDALERTRLKELSKLKGEKLEKAARELASELFANTHPVYGMLFELQGLEVVRIIEGRE